MKRISYERLFSMLEFMESLLDWIPSSWFDLRNCVSESALAVGCGGSNVLGRLGRWRGRSFLPLPPRLPCAISSVPRF